MTNNSQVPTVRVGIVTAPEIGILLVGDYIDTTSKRIITGEFKVKAGEEVCLEPVHHELSSFRIYNVTIGIGFHWQKKEDQVFRGGFYTITRDGNVTLVNIISVEEYLLSVISSEMRATSPIGLLKAHAVISRSWLLAQIHKGKLIAQKHKTQTAYTQSENEIIAWYDREDHRDFDVCADDHCQRYQGITRAYTNEVQKAIYETRGEVLQYNGELCDTRFSKCCGGITERFENVWEPVAHGYLTSIADGKGGHDLPDLKEESESRKWITSAPEAFCNTNSPAILSLVLNDYDQTTQDFYRWTVEYNAEDLGKLILEKTGIDFGSIIDLVPLKRGESGRIIKLKISGVKKEMIIGKELEIRKALSKTHLYSSAFVVDKRKAGDDVFFTLHGAGWGHGVGLCQIGAAVMGNSGYTYKEILEHYFRGAHIEKQY